MKAYKEILYLIKRVRNDNSNKYIKKRWTLDIEKEK